MGGIPLFGLVKKARIGQAFLAFVANPADTPNVIRMYEGLKDGEISQQYFHQLLSNKNVMNLVNERWRYPDVDIDRLMALDDNTFGKQYALFITENGLDPGALNDLREAQSDVDYLTNRLRHVHDMMHVILGFTQTDLAAETGVAAFNMAHIRSFLGGILVFGSLLHCLRVRDYRGFDDILKATSAGISIGMETLNSSLGCVYAFRFEDYWDRPISELRHDLNVSAFHRPTQSLATEGSCRHF